MLKCIDLLCEYQENPIGIDERNPRFAWKIESDKEEVLQTAYEIKIDGVWESGKVESDSYFDAVYSGAGLEPSKEYIWSVRVWDNKGEVSEWASASFETAIFGEWTADWITCDEEKLSSCPVFRKKFLLDGDIKNARIYATALGNYEILLNGERVGEEWMMPGFVSYNKRLPYQTFKATNLKKGENEICVILTKGWARGQVSLSSDIFGLNPGIIIEMKSGYDTILKTDADWEYSGSAYISSELYDGETYDAALEEDVFKTSYKATILDFPKNHLVAQNNEPVRITGEIKPIEIIHTPKGETVIDFGQNMVGWASFKVSGKKGERVILSHAEVLDKDGNFYTGNMRSAKNIVEYRLKGEGVEEYHPHFCFQGFRYVRVDEFPGEACLENFTGLVIHSDFKRTGYFECGNDEVNKLYENVIWGQKGNFVDLPTDCPQRDERLGWTGDAQVFIKTASLNFRVTAFFEKWLTDLKLSQNEENGVPHVIPYIGITGSTASAVWGDAATICPWEIYRAFGDKRVLERQFDSMCRWVDFVRSHTDENEFLWNTGFHFGDWLALDNGEGEYKGRTAHDFIATIFYAHSARLTAKAAAVLGKEAEKEKYEDLYKNIRKEFAKEFITPSGRLTEDTQTGYALALFFDMTDNKERAVKRLAELVEVNGMRLNTGFVGTPYLCHALTEYGRSDIAYNLLLQTEFPSWLYSVRKGATTIWEHWDGIKPDGSFWSDDMNSYNHYAYGAIADWMYTKAAGINYDEQEPGYKHIIIKPVPDKRLGYVRAEVETMYGKVVSAWKYESDEIKYSVEIPAGAYADFIFPDGSRKRLWSGKHSL